MGYGWPFILFDFLTIGVYTYAVSAAICPIIEA